MVERVAMVMMMVVVVVVVVEMLLMVDDGGESRGKKRSESEFDQNHNFRDVIGSRACAKRYR